MIVELKTGFRSRFNMRHLERLWHPGCYVVGVHMPREVAEAAMKAGAAVEIKPAVTAAPEPVTEEVAAPAPTPTFRGRRARRSAPENK